MKHTLAFLLAFVATLAAAQVTSTRTTPYDWQCTDANGVKISDHARFDTAFVACLNAPNGSLVKGGTYRIGKPSSSSSSSSAAGTAALTWTTPTQNTDRTPIGAIAGYKVYYNQTGGPIQSIAVPAVNTITVTGLSSGTWFFRIATISAALGEGGQSNPASKTL